MDETTQEIVKMVADKTQSELILFFIIAAIVLIAFLLPLYGLILGDRKARRAQDNTRHDKYIERESRIIDVIANNSEIIAGLKATLEISHASHTTSLNRIHARIDGLCANTNTVAASLAKAMALFDEIVRRQQNNAEDIKKLLQHANDTP